MLLCHRAGMVYRSWVTGDAGRADAYGSLAASVAAAPSVDLAYLAAGGLGVGSANAPADFSFWVLAVLWCGGRVNRVFCSSQSFVRVCGLRDTGPRRALVGSDTLGDFIARREFPVGGAG